MEMNVGLHQWTQPPEPVRVTLSDGNGLYVDALITFDQRTEPSLAEAIMRAPKWYVITNPEKTP